MSHGRAVYAGTLVLLIAASVVVGVIPDNTAQPQPQPLEAGSFNETDDGVQYTVPPHRLRQGCPGGTDCIPSIDDPRFQSAESARWLQSNDLVIGVAVDGEAKAYPLRILNVHEVVNDRIGNTPIAVTYCPLCRSGLVFSRRVGNATVTFGVSGKLLAANLVLYDRQTGSYWSQIRGEAIVGPLVPHVLDQRPSTITTWEQWRTAHPDAVVLSRDTGISPVSTYDANPYSGYANNSGVPFGVDHDDDRLPSKHLVYGVTVGGSSRAYPADIVRNRTVITDEIGGEPVLLVEDPADGSVRGFSRTVENETLSFRAAEGALVDQHGHRWSYEGRALSGPREGSRLATLNTHGFYWFAWRSFHPETDVYDPNGNVSG